MTTAISGHNAPLLWGVFAAAVMLVVGLDLGVLHRRSQALGARGNGAFCLFVVALTAAFGGLVWQVCGHEAGLLFFTGYVVEEALSIDNLFVFLVIFRSFGVPPALQQRTLFWGVFGALIMRAVFISAGAALIERFSWLFYVFGAILIVTALRLLRKQEAHAVPTNARWVTLYNRLIPSTPALHGAKFWVYEQGRWVATPLLLVLVMVEISDIVFAVDSIPAIFAVTTDTFLVYTSNVFAILGLRSLYFVLASMMERFVYLRFGLCAVLLFVGVKMLVHDIWHISTAASLAIIFGSLLLSIIPSCWRRPT